MVIRTLIKTFRGGVWGGGGAELNVVDAIVCRRV